MVSIACLLQVAGLGSDGQGLRHYSTQRTCSGYERKIEVTAVWTGGVLTLFRVGGVPPPVLPMGIHTAAGKPQMKKE